MYVRWLISTGKKSRREILWDSGLSCKHFLHFVPENEMSDERGYFVRQCSELESDQAFAEMKSEFMCVSYISILKTLN